MAKARKSPTRRAKVLKIDHGINIGLLLVVIVVVLALSVFLASSIINAPTAVAGDSQQPVGNYSSTYQLDETAK